MVGTASKLRIDDGLWNPLLNGTAAVEITPAQVHFALLPETMTQLGRKLDVTRTGDRIALAF